MTNATGGHTPDDRLLTAEEITGIFERVLMVARGARTTRGESVPELLLRLMDAFRITRELQADAAKTRAATLREVAAEMKAASWIPGTDSYDAKMLTFADALEQRAAQGDGSITAYMYTCPTGVEGDEVRGCGQKFIATPDSEGLIDCPHCGIWFDPTKERAAQEEGT